MMNRRFFQMMIVLHSADGRSRESTFYMCHCGAFLPVRERSVNLPAPYGELLVARRSDYTGEVCPSYYFSQGTGNADSQLPPALRDTRQKEFSMSIEAINEHIPACNNVFTIHKNANGCNTLILALDLRESHC
ncbi:hypothetical protein RCIA10 [Methanocella arvoryzae MRE50]|uniref:Uncharacterized protein n=1 Tax=Methanocella arvoryzae (strain DSM 22066 / NBRC 105507 / MRE50) TaxID=351160 RepID=Q0W7F3_METAR|nr:hypothetical protein RCIA10 [Methanocella arvoryzae MRE50]